MGVWKTLLSVRMELKKYSMVPGSRRPFDNEIRNTMQIIPISTAITSILLLAAPQHGHCQGTFRNLDFERPVLPLNPDLEFQVPITNGLPGWRGYIGGSPVDRVLYNTIALDAAAISLQNPSSPGFQGFPAVQGSYYVLLQGSSVFAPTASAAIGQTGFIPATAKSLIFWGYAGPDNVSFKGQTLSLIQAGATTHYNIYEADISGFAGQTGQLLFTAPPGYWDTIDNIQFSSIPVPEPSEIALAVMGALVLGLRRWLMRKR
jgi:hypothetical protein